MLTQSSRASQARGIAKRPGRPPKKSKADCAALKAAEAKAAAAAKAFDKV